MRRHTDFGKEKIMKVALTGATGFIGAYIAREFMKPGDTLRALVRPGSDASFLEAGGAEVVRGDFSDDRSLRRLIRGVDAVVHNGYWHDRNELEEPMKWFELNVLASLKMLEWCRRAGMKRYVFISTGAVYGPGPRILGRKVIDELTGTFPRGGYAAYNRAVEVYVEAYRLEFGMAGSTSIRLCGRNIGLHRRLDMCPYLDVLRDALAGRDIRVSGTEQFDCCVDIARNLRRILTLPMKKVEEVSCFADKPHRMRDVARTIVKAVGSSSRIVEERAKDAFLPVSNARLLATGGKFSGLAGIADYAAEMKAVLIEKASATAASAARRTSPARSHFIRRRKRSR
jgi:nucleoside-diphosphate-sugar epimerase